MDHPLKGRKQTAEHVAARAAALKGNQNALGFKHTVETRSKDSAAKMGNQARLGLKNSAETRAKIGAALKGRNKGQRVPGSYGVPTSAEAKLLSYLPTTWVLHHLVPGMSPKACVVDIAHPERRIAVEVDGKSHDTPAQKARDAEKTAWLTARGWYVLRVTNAAVFGEPGLQSKVCEMLAETRAA